MYVRPQWQAQKEYKSGRIFLGTFKAPKAPAIDRSYAASNGNINTRREQSLVEKGIIIKLPLRQHVNCGHWLLIFTIGRAADDKAEHPRRCSCQLQSSSWSLDIHRTNLIRKGTQRRMKKLSCVTHATFSRILSFPRQEPWFVLQHTNPADRISQTTTQFKFRRDLCHYQGMSTGRGLLCHYQLH